VVAATTGMVVVVVVVVVVVGILPWWSSMAGESSSCNSNATQLKELAAHAQNNAVRPLLSNAPLGANDSAVPFKYASKHSTWP